MFYVRMRACVLACVRVRACVRACVRMRAYMFVCVRVRVRGGGERGIIEGAPSWVCTRAGLRTG